ncbi:XRE family transcriptional regulator [Atopomonas hussainii]|uniref:XRE family transcriptional regulator n=1 Tax=Atopomonas hussainii TaxID=1429083 RepID=UPI001113DD47|nr:XRE family transcriptional regulator [Atopomonas hussainii]
MNQNSLANYVWTGEAPSRLAVLLLQIFAFAEYGADYTKLLSSIEIEPKKPRDTKRGGLGANKKKSLYLLNSDICQGTAKASHGN